MQSLMHPLTHPQKQTQKQGTSIFAHTDASKTFPHPTHTPWQLQCTIGSQAVQQTLQTHDEEIETGPSSSRFGHDFSRIPARSPTRAQTNLTINPPGDRLEQEAEQVSERVMQMPGLEGSEQVGSAHVQITPPRHGLEHLQFKQVESVNLAQPPAPTMVHEALNAPGQPLDPATRAFMEPRFGQDFTQVRVHTNSNAAASAEAMHALAYTVGNRIVFGAGQYAPASPPGKRLLAHELTHVIQQTAAPRARTAIDHPISRAPVGVSRKTPTTTEQAIKFHEADQRLIAGFLDNARKIKPDPKKDYRNPDNLFHNTVGLLDGGKLTLTVLSPTHVNPDLHFDTRVQFDGKGNHFGGTYSKFPVDGFEGVLEDKTSADGKVLPPSASTATGTGTVTKKPEEKIERVPYGTKPPPPKSKSEPEKPAPPPAQTSQAPALPAYPVTIAYFTRGGKVTEGKFRNTFVHEGQHVADMHPPGLSVTNIDDKIQGYKTEFRAFWIQPPIPLEKDGIALETPFPEPTNKAENTRKVTIAKPTDCKYCKPANASAPSEAKTEMKNERQEGIFWHIMKNYPVQQYDCCYVYNDKFRKAVNDFAYPTSVNLINSDRIMNLNLEIQKLKSSMKLAELNSTQFVPLVAKLDAFDWKFLNDPKLSKPFWEALKSLAPEFVYNGMIKLLKKVKKAPFSEADIKKAFLR